MRYLIVLFAILSTINSFAQSEPKGIGVMLGNPTGLNGKYWINEERAVDGGFALSLGAKNNLSIHSDYLLHDFSSFYLNDTIPLDLYYGIGGRMEFADDVELGVRAPVGLAHQLKDQNADVFAEIAPILDFVGRTGLELHLAVGGRYYFN